MPARDPLRRRVLWWGTMLLLAAVINWIVAWACALWSPVRRGAISAQWLDDRPAPGAAIFATPTAGEARLYRLDRVPRAWREHEGAFGFPPDGNIIRYAGRGLAQADIELTLHVGRGRTATRRVVVVDCGWPMHCLSGELLIGGLDLSTPGSQAAYLPFSESRQASPDWDWAITAPPWLRPAPLRWPTGPLSTRVLPYRPLTLGLAVNTLLWWAVLVCPVSLCRTARRALRRRRGLCAACGYDARGLPVCPECGEPRQLDTPYPGRPHAAA